MTKRFLFASLTCIVGAVSSSVSAAQFVLTSRNNQTIVTYDLATGGYLSQIGPAAELRIPADIEVRPNGNYLISNFDSNSNDIIEYTPAGAFVRGLTSNRLEEVTAVKERDGHIYALANDTRRVGVFDSTSGSFLYDFSNDQGFAINFPSDMEFRPGGNDDLYISVEGFANRIQVWDPISGKYRRSFGSELQYADGLAFGGDGLLYVSDFGAGNIKRFDPLTGTYLGIFATVSGPSDLGFGPDGLLYVSTLDMTGVTAGNVVRFNGTTGAPLGEFIPAYGATIGPGGFAFIGSVPEPTSAALLAAVGIVASRRKR